MKKKRKKDGLILVLGLALIDVGRKRKEGWFDFGVGVGSDLYVGGVGVRESFYGGVGIGIGVGIECY